MTASAFADSSNEHASFTVIATVVVKDGAVEKFKIAADALTVATRQEPANIDFTFVQSPTEPTKFATIEHWRTQAGIEDHMSSNQIKAFSEAAGQLFQTGYPQIEVYTNF